MLMLCLSEKVPYTMPCLYKSITHSFLFFLTLGPLIFWTPAGLQDSDFRDSSRAEKMLFHLAMPPQLNEQSEASGPLRKFQKIKMRCLVHRGSPVTSNNSILPASTVRLHEQGWGLKVGVCILLGLVTEKGLERHMCGC